jgi:hypothetical protein
VPAPRALSALGSEKQCDTKRGALARRNCTARVALFAHASTRRGNLLNPPASTASAGCGAPRAARGAAGAQRRARHTGTLPALVSSTAVPAMKRIYSLLPASVVKRVRAVLEFDGGVADTHVSRAVRIY